MKVYEALQVVTENKNLKVAVIGWKNKFVKFDKTSNLYKMVTNGEENLYHPEASDMISDWCVYSEAMANAMALSSDMSFLDALSMIVKLERNKMMTDTMYFAEHKAHGIITPITMGGDRGMATITPDRVYVNDNLIIEYGKHTTDEFSRGWTVYSSNAFDIVAEKTVRGKRFKELYSRVEYGWDKPYDEEEDF